MDYVCGRCGILRTSGYDCVECARRKQADMLIQQNERTFQANQEATRRSEQFAIESEREREFNIRQEAHYARQREAEQQSQRHAHERQLAEMAQISSESNISSEDAFNHGVDDATDSMSGSRNIRVYITASGQIDLDFKSPYKTSRLIKKYEAGVWSVVNANVDLSNVSEIIDAKVYEAGYTLYRDGRIVKHFQIDSGITFGDHSILVSKNKFPFFSSEMECEIDMVTGELQYSWDDPFDQDSLNATFREGVIDRHTELNSAEYIKHRLEVDIPQIIEESDRAALAEEKEAERRKSEHEQRELDSKKEVAANKLKGDFAVLTMAGIYIFVPILLLYTSLHGFWVIVYLCIVIWSGSFIWPAIREIFGYQED